MLDFRELTFLNFSLNDKVEVVQCLFDIPLVRAIANFRNSQLEIGDPQSPNSSLHKTESIDACISTKTKPTVTRIHYFHLLLGCSLKVSTNCPCWGHSSVLLNTLPFLPQDSLAASQA